MTGNLFAGSGALTRFILRRDRARLLIWLVGLAMFVVALVPVFDNLLVTAAGNRVMAEMMRNPAMIAIVGPVYGIDDYHTGAAYANMMLEISVMIAGVMNIFLVTRHTRADEELGRLEVVRSLPVGRLSNPASAMIVSLMINAALAAVSGLSLYAIRSEGMSFSGCMLFGAAMGVIGFFFASATALFCQLSANTRTANGLSFMLLMVLYMMRAVGDLGTEMLSLISPLGLILRTQNFVNDYWWPAGVILGISATLALLALGLARIRDLGSGLLSEKAGRRHASRLLSSPFGLAIRLLKTSIIVWMVAIFVMAAMYGSVFGDLEGFIDSNAMLKLIFTLNSSFSLTEQFIVMLMAVISMLSTVPVLSIMRRVWSEEQKGYSEHVFGKAVSRSEQFAAYLIPAFCVSVILQLLAALGFWCAGSMVMEDVPPLGTFAQAALAYLPAIWVMLGVSMALIAYLPGKTSAAYVYLGYSLFSIYIGRIVGLPKWMNHLTPYGFIPQIPVEEMQPVNLVVLTAIAIALGVLGFIGYGKRDMRTQ